MIGSYPLIELFVAIVVAATVSVMLIAMSVILIMLVYSYYRDTFKKENRK